MRIPSVSSKRKARIEIIPLIDIMFFLLATFVMVSLSMIKNQGVAVNLPTAATGTQQDRKAAVTITVTENGDLYLDKHAVSLDQMVAELKEKKAADPELRVFINGDERAFLGAAINVLDEIRKTGIQKVSIQTKGQTSSAAKAAS